MSALLQDLRYGVRMLVKTPVVSVVAALSLALGIAGASAMFALASGFFLSPLPFGDQDHLILVRQIRPGEGIENAAGVSSPNFRDLVDGTSTLEAATAFGTSNVNVTGVDQPEQIRVIEGTPAIFDVLRVQPFMGRGFRAGEGVAGARNVVVLTHAFWQSRFQGDPGVVGRTLMLDGRAHTIVGVMPETFEMVPANVQAFRPSDLSDDSNRSTPNYIMLGRLRPGATPGQAAAEIGSRFQRLVTENAEANRNWTVVVTPVRDWFPGPTDTKLVLLLIVVSLFGLAIACANVANLLLGRAELRLKEMAVRTAMGAGRGRMLRQLLTESVLLALLGGAIGTVLSLYTIAGLQTAMPPEMPHAFWPVLDRPTLAATVAVAMLAGVLFGLAPALHATGGSLREALGEHSRGGTAGRTRKRLRNFFVAAEIAVAVALLTGAAFLMRAMDLMVNQDPGFDGSGLLTFQVTLPESRYPEAQDMARFTAEAERTLRAVPGITDVAVMASLPRSRGNTSSPFHIEGTPVVPVSEQPTSGWQAVNPAYFEALRIPLVSGRALEESDRALTAPVVVVSREFARRWLPDGKALGARIEIEGQAREVVGMVEDIIQSRIPPGAHAEPAVYMPLPQQPLRNPSFALRMAGRDMAGVAADVRRAIATVDPDQPVALLRTLDEHIAESLAGPRALSGFVLALGTLAMVLAAIGIYGVMAHSVVQSTREIGIRMAVGARQGQVVGMIARRGLTLTGLGLLAGLPIALLVHRGVLSALDLFEVDVPADYALLAVGGLIAVAFLASGLPALRAARVQPVSALQNE
jgi:putative ABC transport system permease protein